ncbi:hypothetical protein D6C97_00810 [Aureobasidium pullulans]|nr:hypothetical protein D6C97_00810 [Aureobasidium pullulans]THZ01303.1 hypothetical protein D6C92_01273 [Aureobasidium pullulans]TIA23128.1 hypothetical protein D6C80_00832 [Aureobasidium pullulans]
MKKTAFLHIMVAPLTIAVTGIAIIPKRAERALLDVEISATGFSRAFISAEVQLSCRRLEDILRKISPANDSQLARESATIAHWSMTSLKTTSHLPTDQYGTVLKNAQRVYSTSVSFDIRIRDFSKLGTFASQVSTLPYTLIHSVRWALTSTTRQAYESKLRAMAAEDALERAKDYAKALGLTAVWPVEVKEAQWGSHDPNAVMKVQEKAMDMRRPVSDSDPAFADLFFEPEEVTMSTRIDCKFEAE